MDRPTPLGLYDERPLSDGVAPYSGAKIPGPLGTVIDRAGDSSAQPRSAGARAAARDESLSLPFVVGAETYWLRRTDTALLRSNEESVPPAEAGAILEGAAVQHRENVAILRLLETAASQLAGVHPGGTFVLVRQRPQPAGSVAESPRIQALPARKPQPAPLPQPPAQVPIEEPVMAATQAIALKKAAASGTPFCEECAKAAAARRGAA